MATKTQKVMYIAFKRHNSTEMLAFNVFSPLKIEFDINFTL